MVARKKLIEWLNTIEWNHASRISEDALALIQRHIELMQDVIKQIVRRKEITADEAHAFAQTAGNESAEYEVLLEELFNRVTFRNSTLREVLIGNIAACYCWSLDPELREMPNPWPPLIELYGMGFTSTTDSDAEGTTVELVVGFKNGEARFPIV